MSDDALTTLTTPGDGTASVPPAGPRRKPRRRAARSAGPPTEPAGPAAAKPAVEPTPGPPGEPAVSTVEKADRPASPKRPTARKAPGQRGRNDSLDRQWRELAGSGRSQVSLSAALRARNAEQPTPEELAEAEAAVVIQHRNWLPTSDG